MTRSWTVLLAMGLSASVLAADIGDEIRRSGQPLGDYNGGYFEISASAGCGHSAVVYGRKERAGGVSECGNGWGMGGEYRYNGLFFEATSKGQDGINIGYTLWSNPGWSVDLLAASAGGALYDRNGSIDSETPGLSDPVRDYAILHRDTWYTGAGMRVTHYFGPNIIQFRLVTDVHGGNGVTSTARLGRAWQIRNWNFHGLGSLVYRSAKTNQYYFGISELEQTERFPVYNAGSSVDASFEVGATYPLSEHWVFRSEVRLTPILSSIRDSPLIGDSWSGSVGATISYVF